MYSELVYQTGFEGIDKDNSKYTLPTKELAEAFLAMMQLMSLRQAWIGDFEPQYDIIDVPAIIFNGKEIKVDSTGYSHPLSFPSIEEAVEFKNYFIDLIKIAKPLL